MPQRSLTLKVGRYEVTGDCESVQLSDGTSGIISTDLGRLELEAAILVLSQATSLLGEELRFVRHAMGLHVAEFAHLLHVPPETVSRWETSVEPIERQTQLAVLLCVEHFVRYGSPRLLPQDLVGSSRIVVAS